MGRGASETQESGVGELVEVVELLDRNFFCLNLKSPPALIKFRQPAGGMHLSVAGVAAPSCSI